MDRPVPEADTLLVIDVGNTRVGLALWDESGLHDVRRESAHVYEDWRAAIEDLWRQSADARRRAVVIGSVSPRTAALVRDAVEELCDVEPLFVRDDLPLPLPLDIENADEVGVDRVCSAAAAFDRLRTACAVASFGTATTVDCVSQDGRFLGGAILPGVEMSCEALHDGTQQLPHVQAGQPSGPFGRNTHDAIVNGVIYGTVGALRELVERYATELGQWPQLVITGGNAELVRENANFVDNVVPDLCLMGIALAYRKASQQV